MGTSRKPVVVSASETSTFVSSEYLYPPEYEGHFSKCMLKRDEIQERIRELAKLISEDYQKRRPLLLCTLKGANPFFCHLGEALQELRQGYDVEFVRATSYEGTGSTGKVEVSGFNAARLENRHVIVIEDILDTGTTLAHLVPYLEKESKPKSVEVMTLLDKRIDEEKKYAAKYIGFSIPNEFIIGYGLDFNELYRDLGDIFVISAAGIDFDRKGLYDTTP